MLDHETTVTIKAYITLFYANHESIYAGAFKNLHSSPKY